MKSGTGEDTIMISAILSTFDLVLEYLGRRKDTATAISVVKTLRTAAILEAERYGYVVQEKAQHEAIN